MRAAAAPGSSACRTTCRTGRSLRGEAGLDLPPVPLDEHGLWQHERPRRRRRAPGRRSRRRVLARDPSAGSRRSPAARAGPSIRTSPTFSGSSTPRTGEQRLQQPGGRRLAHPVRPVDPDDHAVHASGASRCPVALLWQRAPHVGPHRLEVDGSDAAGGECPFEHRERLERTAQQSASPVHLRSGAAVEDRHGDAPHTRTEPSGHAGQDREPQRVADDRRGCPEHGTVDRHHHQPTASSAPTQGHAPQARSSSRSRRDVPVARPRGCGCSRASGRRVARRGDPTGAGRRRPACGRPPRCSPQHPCRGRSRDGADTGCFDLGTHGFDHVARCRIAATQGKQSRSPTRTSDGTGAGRRWNGPSVDPSHALTTYARIAGAVLTHRSAAPGRARRCGGARRRARAAPRPVAVGGRARPRRPRRSPRARSSRAPVPAAVPGRRCARTACP